MIIRRSHTSLLSRTALILVAGCGTVVEPLGGNPNSSSSSSDVSSVQAANSGTAASSTLPPTITQSETTTSGAATTTGARSTANSQSEATQATTTENDPARPGTSETTATSSAPASSTASSETEASEDAGGAIGTDSTSEPPEVNNEPCVESQSRDTGSGSGPYEVVIETNSDPGINEGTIFRPSDLSGDEKYPIFAWGQGGCSRNGLSNSAAMIEIASHGYFVIADGTPNGSGSRSMNPNDIPSMGEPLLAYVDWAIAENAKPCSAYYQALDTSKVATNGFSCGGLMAEGTASDQRLATWGITSSGMFSANQALYDSIHTPVLIVLGGPSDDAYENGKRDYDNISGLDVPVLLFSKDIGHGGDLFQRGGGDFTKINLAWLNWWLKGDEGATGKGLLVGDGCTYCSDSAWEVAASNVP